MTFLRTSLIPPLVLATALLAACGGDDGTAADAPTTADADDAATSETTGADTDGGAAGAGGSVTIESSRFSPDPLEVAAGTEVTFENTDPFAHTVTAAEESPVAFDSGELGQDETFSQTFDEPGTYPYFCEIHPTMRAEVVVS